MRNIVFPERLVIVEARKLIGESLLALFLKTNVFPSIIVAHDCSELNFQTEWSGLTVFLIAGSSYLRIRQTVISLQTLQTDSTIVILDEHFRCGGGLLVRETNVHGYWTFQDTAEIIVEGIIEAVNRRRSISPLLGKHLNHSAQNRLQLSSDLKEHPLYKLSKRERQLFYLISSGRKMEACATEMGIAKKTVSNLREKLMKKFGVKSGTDLVWKAVETGLIGPFAAFE